MGSWCAQRNGDVVAFQEPGEFVMLRAALEVVGQEPPPATWSTRDEPSGDLTGLMVTFREVAHEVHRVRSCAFDGHESGPRESVRPEEADANDTVGVEPRVSGQVGRDDDRQHRADEKQRARDRPEANATHRRRTEREEDDCTECGTDPAPQGGVDDQVTVAHGRQGRSEGPGSGPDARSRRRGPGVMIHPPDDRACRLSVRSGPWGVRKREDDR